MGASDGDCGKIMIDCHTHKMTIGNSPPKTINCGANGTTPSTKGVVGGPHKGEIVKDGVDIRAPGMGQDGGGKVFHTPNPDDKSSVPQGNDSTKGCIAVDNEDLEKLKKCKDAPLEIIGNGDARGSSTLPGQQPYSDPNRNNNGRGNATR
jgi:hypothetical protein